MGAFIAAGIVFVLTLLGSGFVLFADSMSDAPGSSVSVAPVFFGGLIISLALLASHWLSPIGW